MMRLLDEGQGMATVQNPASHEAWYLLVETRGSWGALTNEGRTMSNQTMLTAVVLMLLAPMMACGELETQDLMEEESLESQEQEVRGGFAYTTVPNSFEAIGRMNSSTGGCTATLISEYAALTAAHCGPDGGTVTFIAPNGRGSLTGTLVHHPLFEDIKWMSHDYAVVKFPQSIHATSGFNASGLQPIAIGTEPKSPPLNVRIIGYGRSGSGCAVGANGQLRTTTVAMDSFLEDWHYKLDDSIRGTCPGDSGGPELIYEGGQYKIIGVSSWINAGSSQSYHKVSYSIAAWAREQASRPDLPGNTWGNCVIYNGTSPSSTSYGSYQGNHANLNGWSNYASSVWVKKGYEMIGYNGTNYTTELGRRDGYNGSQCNEHGCFHQLTGAMNNSISSLKCSSDLPGNTWGHCVLYDRFPGTYLSVQGHHATLDGGNWNNRAKQLWVKAGHSARVYSDENYQNNNYWNSQLYSGNSGGQCNSYGCLYDFVGTKHEATIGSMRCY